MRTSFTGVIQLLLLLCQYSCFKACLPFVLLGLCLLIIVGRTAMFISCFLRMVFLLIHFKFLKYRFCFIGKVLVSYKSLFLIECHSGALFLLYVTIVDICT